MSGKFSKYALVGVLSLIPIVGAAYYKYSTDIQLNKLQDQLSVQRDLNDFLQQENHILSTNLEVAVQDRKNNEQLLLKEREESKMLIIKWNEAEAQLAALRDKFSRHDFEKLSEVKPEMMERITNEAINDLWSDFERITAQ